MYQSELWWGDKPIILPRGPSEVTPCQSGRRRLAPSTHRGAVVQPWLGIPATFWPDTAYVRRVGARRDPFDWPFGPAPRTIKRRLATPQIFIESATAWAETVQVVLTRSPLRVECVNTVSQAWKFTLWSWILLSVKA